MTKLILMTDSYYSPAQPQTKKDDILGHSISPTSKDRAGIVFTLDRGYLKQLSVMLASIIEHANEKKTYDLIVYENTFTEKDRRQLKAQCPQNISLRFFDVTHRLKTDLKGITLYTRSWWTNAIWYKCLIPFVMRQYRQTLYLDVDAIVQTDIANLFDDQQNTPLAAVRDVLAYTIHAPENQKTAQYLKNIGIEHPENYFNAGVLRYNHALIDIDQYQQNLISTYTQKGPFNCPEQDLLNILYQTNVTLMPFENNYQIQINPSQTFKQNYQKLEHKPLEQSSHNAKILHYFGAIKPWHLKTPVIEHLDTYWQYIKTSPYKHDFEQEAQQSQNQLVAQQKHPYRLRLNYIKAKLLSKLSQNEKKDYWEQQRQYYKNQLIKTKAIKNLSLCALTDTDTPDSVSTPSRVSTPVKPGLTLEQAKQLLADNLTETQLLGHIENITFPEKPVVPIKTIAIFYPRLHQGGVERVISLQIPHYLELGLTVILITALIDKEKDYPLDPRVIRITLPRNIEEGRIEQLQKICQKHTVDCFIHHDSSGPTIL